MAKTTNTVSAGGDPPTLTIALYQNGDYVSGLLQQAYERGLLRRHTHEHEQGSAATEGRDSGTDVSLGVGADVPFLAKAQVEIGHGRKRQVGGETRQEDRVTSSFEYTEAHYLHIVRRHLREVGVLHHVTSATDAQGVTIGDFVEFQAAFRPNQVTPFLDVLTPELVSRIAHYRRMKAAASTLGAVEGFEGLEGFDRIKAFAEQAKMLADADADLARAVATAVRADFRGAATREYHGGIGMGSDSVTAVTICDAACFLVDDEDRLLDGSFTVLGKVTTTVSQDVPALSRNKLLRRLDADFVDTVLGQLRTETKKGAAKLPGGQQAVEEVLDATFESRIAGPSFNVIPIAIYL